MSDHLTQTLKMCLSAVMLLLLISCGGGGGGGKKDPKEEELPGAVWDDSNSRWDEMRWQ